MSPAHSASSGCTVAMRTQFAMFALCQFAVYDFLPFPAMSPAHLVALPRGRGLRPMPREEHRFPCASTENGVPSAAQGSLPMRKKSLAHIAMCKGRINPRYHPSSCQNDLWQTLIYTVTGITRCSLLKMLRTLFNSKTPVRNSITIGT